MKLKASECFPSPFKILTFSKMTEIINGFFSYEMYFVIIISASGSIFIGSPFMAV